MSFIDELRGSRKSPASALQLFLLTFPKAPDHVHGFFEGNDDALYYLNFILRYEPKLERVHVYKCGGKDGVYKAHSTVMKHVSSGSAVLFFVDKDLSDLLDENWPQSHNIFVTEHYSIENYLVTEEMLRRLWAEVFHVKGASIDYEAIEKKFQDELSQFHRLMVPIVAWIVLARRGGLRPNLDNVSLDKMLTFDDDLVLQTKVDPESMVETVARMAGVADTTVPDAESTENLQQTLARLSPKRYVRGKFEMWFFVKFLNKLAICIKKQVLGSKGSISVRTQITITNAVEILGPRCRMPAPLKSFLQSNIGNLV